MQNLSKLIKMDFYNLITSKTWVILGFLCPVVFILLFGFLGSGSYGGEITSYDYFGITFMLYSILMSSTFAANSFLEDRVKLANLRVLKTPTSEFSLPFSKVIVTFLFTDIIYFFSALFVYFVCAVNFGGKNIFYVTILFLIMNFLSSCVGIFISCLMKTEKATNTIIGMLSFFLSILSGIFFPLDVLGETIVKIGNYSPLKWLIDTLFEIIYDDNFIGFIPTTYALLGLSLVFIVLIKFSFKQEVFLND